MKPLFKLRSFIRRFGIDVRSFPGAEYGKLKRFLDNSKVNLLLDVGANFGQYAEEIRELGYKGRIISFEPQIGVFHQLEKKAARQKNWSVFNLALGENSGVSVLNVSANTASSSILPMLPVHADSAPESRFVDTEEVRVERLDRLISDIATPDDRIFLKIDTQGFEEKVLNGADGCMDRILGIQLEMSIAPLYDGEMLFDDMRRKIESYGFVLSSLIPGFSEPSTGRLLQVDGIFIRIPKT